MIMKTMSTEVATTPTEVAAITQKLVKLNIVASNAFDNPYK
jgi:hypothetical protein